MYIPRGSPPRNISKNITRENAVYLAGREALKEDFAARGIRLTEEKPDVCVLAYDTALTFEKLVKLNEFLVGGSFYVATHPDVVCPALPCPKPDVGSFIKLLEASSGRLPDAICGKPPYRLWERR